MIDTIDRAPQAPMRLLRNEEFFATIITYSYETPWATGDLVVQDGDQYDRYMSEEDSKWYENAHWTIVTRDGREHAIYALDFFDDGSIQWRW